MIPFAIKGNYQKGAFIGRSFVGLLVAPLITALCIMFFTLVMSIFVKNAFWGGVWFALIQAAVSYEIYLIFAAPVIYLAIKFRCTSLLHFIFIGLFGAVTMFILLDAGTVSSFWNSFLQGNWTSDARFKGIAVNALFGIIQVASYWLIARPDCFVGKSYQSSAGLI